MTATVRCILKVFDYHQQQLPRALFTAIKSALGLDLPSLCVLSSIFSRSDKNLRLLSKAPSVDGGDLAVVRPHNNKSARKWLHNTIIDFVALSLWTKCVILAIRNRLSIQ